MRATYRKTIGDFGENIVSNALSALGWTVRNLNDHQRNFPNCDLEIVKGYKQLRIEVKTCTSYGWISAGSVNPVVCGGGPIFNRQHSLPQADFVICLTPRAKSEKGKVPDEWRFFVLPVAVAEREFRKNINTYFNGTKRDGTPRSKNGAAQDFVGPGACSTKIIIDHKEDYAPYEDRFDLLES